MVGSRQEVGVAGNRPPVVWSRLEAKEIVQVEVEEVGKKLVVVAN